jgi:hypothetical protein
MIDCFPQKLFTGINKTFASLYKTNQFMRIICLFLFLLVALPSAAQIIKEETKVEKDSVAPIVDPLYREDQFYASISYNMIQSKPQGYSPNSISSGITVGFLRDMPVNEARTHAIAIGFGYSYNNIKSNL